MTRDSRSPAPTSRAPSRVSAASSRRARETGASTAGGVVALEVGMSPMGFARLPAAHGAAAIGRDRGRPRPLAPIAGAVGACAASSRPCRPARSARSAGRDRIGAVRPGRERPVVQLRSRVARSARGPGGAGGGAADAGQAAVRTRSGSRSRSGRRGDAPERRCAAAPSPLHPQPVGCPAAGIAAPSRHRRQPGTRVRRMRGAVLSRSPRSSTS